MKHAVSPTRCHRVRTVRVLALAATLILNAGAARSLYGAPLTFGIVPQQSATMLARHWGPVLRYLSHASGYQLAFRTAPDIPTFEQRVREGAYQIAYMNPYHYTVFHAAPGYEAFARARDRRITGIIVVRRDNPIGALAGLAGTSLAFPAPASFAATVLPQTYLRRHGIAFSPVYVASHDSVYRAVAKGLYPAGGGIERTFRGVAPDVSAELRVLWTSPGYTPHAFAAHPALDPVARERIAAAMYAMADDSTGRELLAPLNLKGFDRASDSEWDDVRALDIQIPER